jgi:Zn-dependent alcohol dehydrogenase
MVIEDVDLKPPVAGEVRVKVRAAGGFAEDTVVPATNVISLPDDVPFEVGALVGCAVATGFGVIANAA